ncbi:hypothetical protein ACFFX0_10560 [Citricoccus parietis]|uniref:Uncharacterized protein n=1 Tax=Citricoccus parietis TaxID=592307 RepID=A0ABV5FY89_9MICC
MYLGTRVIVLSSSPTFVLDDVRVDLGAERSQVETRSEKRFADLRARVYGGIQRAKAKANAVTAAK